MGRPPKKEGTPVALEKLHSAFWEALKEKPFHEITVSEVARRAGVNKNTLYYHYHNLIELAEGAINEELLTDIPNTLFNPQGETQGLTIQERITLLPTVLEQPENKTRWNKLRLILGDHGTNELSFYLKTCIVQAALKGSDATLSSMSQEAKFNILFTINGIFGVLSSGLLTPEQEETFLQQCYKTEIVQNSIMTSLHSLKPDMTSYR